MTLFIHGGHVLTLDGQRVEPANLIIEADRIADLGPGLSMPPEAQVVDASNHLVLPGLVNAHTHSHNNLMRGIASNWTLEDQLNHGWATLAGRTPEDQYLSAMVGAIEMVKTGCTAAFDMVMALPALTSEMIDAVVQAYVDVGMRVVLAPAFADMSFYRTVPHLLDHLPPDLRKNVEDLQTNPAESLLRLVESAIKRWDGFANGRIRIGIGPTIPGQCTDQCLVGCARLMQQYGVCLQTHLAETKIQVLFAQKRWGHSIVTRLASLGLIGPTFSGAHAVWLTQEDIAQLAARGACAAHNPASNLRLGSGIAPVREMLDAGLTVGLGTDGAMSSDNLSMFSALHFAPLVSRIRFPYQQSSWVSSADSWNMATAGSARVLRLPRNGEHLCRGDKADLTLLRFDSIFMSPRTHALNNLVFSETGASIDTVLVDGRIVLEGGQVVGMNEASIMNRAQSASERLLQSNITAWDTAEMIAPYLSRTCGSLAAEPFAVNRFAVPLDTGGSHGF